MWSIMQTGLLVVVLIALVTVILVPWLLRKKDNAPRPAPEGTGVNDNGTTDGVGEDHRPKQPY